MDSRLRGNDGPWVPAFPHTVIPPHRHSLYDGAGPVNMKMGARHRGRRKHGVKGARRAFISTLDTGLPPPSWTSDEAQFVERSFVLEESLFFPSLPLRPRLGCPIGRCSFAL